jgi:hypothetical protein
MPGHSRPKDGVASARLRPGIHVFDYRVWTTKTWMARTSSAKTRFALLPGHDDQYRCRTRVLVLALEPADMLLGVKLEPDPLDQIELGFEEIDVMLLVLHQAFEQVA